MAATKGGAAKPGAAGDPPAAPVEVAAAEEIPADDTQPDSLWRYTDPEPRDYLTYGRLKAGDLVAAAAAPDHRFEPATAGQQEKEG